MSWHITRNFYDRKLDSVFLTLLNFTEHIISQSDNKISRRLNRIPSSPPPVSGQNSKWKLLQAAAEHLKHVTSYPDVVDQSFHAVLCNSQVTVVLLILKNAQRKPFTEPSKRSQKVQNDDLCDKMSSLRMSSVDVLRWSLISNLLMKDEIEEECCTPGNELRNVLLHVGLLSPLHPKCDIACFVQQNLTERSTQMMRMYLPDQIPSKNKLRTENHELIWEMPD